MLGWDDHRYLGTLVESAIAFGKPPCQFILEDPTWKKFTAWDIKIGNAYHIARSSEFNGWPAHIDQSPRVAFEVKERKSKSQHALDVWKHNESKRMEKKGAKPKFGVIPVAMPKVTDGGKMPTPAEYAEYLRSGAEAPGQKNLSTGEVVETATNPEMMREFHDKLKARRSRRRPTGPVD